MGFTITFSGPVTTVYNIDVAAGAIVHIGGGSSHSSGKFQGDACPTKINKAQRTEWGTACAAVDHVAPEGWTAETFSSERAFTNNAIPTGLNKGDAIFYWKKGVSEDDAPSGFTTVYGADDIIVIVPVSSEIEVDDDDADSSLDGGGEDGNFDVPDTYDIVDDDDDLQEVNDDDEEDASSPF